MSRHPNLFFELLVWVGFAIGGLTDYISVIGFIGPILLWLVMDKLTLPLTEKHMKDSRG
jgi:steroid 5-alpha reductase family enzyme